MFADGVPATGAGEVWRQSWNWCLATRSAGSSTADGAVSIPLEELEDRLRELPPDREVVAYCRCPYCAFAPEAVRTLREHGFRARHLSEWLPDWAAAMNSDY